MEDITGAAPPCHITLKGGGVFVVPDINGWEGQEAGILAIGHWWDVPEVELTILFYHDEIRYIIYDFEALRAWQDAQVAEVEEKAA